MKVKELTHVQKIRKENLQVKTQIETLLGWDNHDFCHFQFKAGLRYLEDEIVLNDLAVQEMAEMQSFWSWWRNQWVKRDIQFLKTVMKLGNQRQKTIYRADKIVQTYQNHHQVNAILFAPHKAVLRESYARLIQKINKEVVDG